ncbi:hypothetical protein J3U99_08945 [Brucella pituitosa]|uniref:hypothetical protein n=1 Tax=Brucella pituitosa TaxID=571256 RepID=UPI0020065A0E|nr:hypothetical protein [Brucella pituitosa]MCK4204891.1 hypothetical protein [Brucella pituitosa]
MKFPGKRLIVEYKNRRSHKSGNSLWGDINLKEIAREVETDLSLPENVEQVDFEKAVTDPITHSAHSTQISPTQTDEKSSISQDSAIAEDDTAVEPLSENDIKPISVKQNAASQRKQKTPNGTKADALKIEHAGVKLHDAESVQAANTQPLSSSSSVSSPPQAKARTVVTRRSKKRATVDDMMPLPTPKTTTGKVRRTKQLTRLPIADSHARLLIQDPELNSLEVENRRLKLLLVEHLRAENARLEQMILRAVQVFDVVDESA